MTTEEGWQASEQPGAIELRFTNAEGDLAELSAAHVAEVLSGLVGLTEDAARGGVLGAGPPPEVLIRPPREGSFVLEGVLSTLGDATLAEVGGFIGGGGAVTMLVEYIKYATKSQRAEVEDFDYLDNGDVKVMWTDSTSYEVRPEVWAELNKRKRRRKKQMHKLMAPLSAEADQLHVTVSGVDSDEPPPEVTLDRTDYRLTTPSDEVEEDFDVFDTEAQMVTVDFDSGQKWRVRTREATRTATVEDVSFLRRVDQGLALHKTDIFNLRIREDRVTKNGRTTRQWTVLEVTGHRRGGGDDDD